VTTTQPPETRSASSAQHAQPARLRLDKIPPHKLILALILVGSILFFFLILGAGFIAILREAAPHRHSSLALYLLDVKRIVAHHILHLTHHK